MATMKILLAEDNQQDANNCQDAVDDYNSENTNKRVELVIAKDIQEAQEKLDNTFDGAIIDLKLGDSGDEGNKVIESIEEKFFRIPVIILTGTPDSIDHTNKSIIESLKKGNVTYSDLLTIFERIYATGLTQIMGGRGAIEKTLSNVFLRNLLNQRKKWEEYGAKNPKRTESALLRYTLNHLLLQLDIEDEECFPEEMYIYPPIDEKLRTGGIVKCKMNGSYHVIMNPACDLVVRNNNQPNTDKILVVELKSDNELFSPSNGSFSNTKISSHKNKKLNFHCLPKTDFFDGGLINFRALTSFSLETFEERFEKPEIQISPSFVKDIVARFSSYYARQGQPDIDYSLYLVTDQS